MTFVDLFFNTLIECQNRSCLFSTRCYSPFYRNKNTVGYLSSSKLYFQSYKSNKGQKTIFVTKSLIRTCMYKNKNVRTTHLDVFKDFSLDDQVYYIAHFKTNNNGVTGDTPTGG